MFYTPKPLRRATARLSGPRYGLFVNFRRKEPKDSLSKGFIWLWEWHCHWLALALALTREYGLGCRNFELIRVGALTDN